MVSKKVRVTSKGVAKWAVGAGFVSTAGYLLVAYLISSGLVVVVDHTGDSYCKGTIEDPCRAVVTLRALKDFTIDKGDWQFSSTPKLKQVGLVVNGIDPAKKAVSIKKGQNFTVEIFAYKVDPKDSVKWTLGPLDPMFYPAAQLEWRQDSYNVTREVNVSRFVENCSWINTSYVTDASNHTISSGSWTDCLQTSTSFVTEQVKNGTPYQVIWNPVMEYKIPSDQFAWDDMKGTIIIVDDERCDAEAHKKLDNLAGCKVRYVPYNYTTDGKFVITDRGDSDYGMKNLEVVQ